MAYEIVSYSPELDAGIAAVQRHLWHADPAKNAAYFRWKYRDNPFLEKPLIHLAVSGGSVVAMRGMFGSLWEVDDGASRHVLPYADDLVVAPEHRNQGLVSRIMKANLEDASRRGFPFALSLGSGPVTFVGSLAAGWRSAGSFRLVRLGSAEPRPGSRILGARVPMLDRLQGALRARGFSRAFRRLDREGRRSRGPIRLARAPRPDEMAELVARLPWDGRVRHVRNSAYFTWRFRNPLHEYRFLFHQGGARLDGYLVLQRKVEDRAGLARINIADWEASDHRVGADLLAAALDWGCFSLVQAWTVSASESMRGLLESRGFAPVARDGVRRRSEGLLVRLLADAAGPWMLGSRALLDVASWDLRMLYSMAA